METNKKAEEKAKGDNPQKYLIDKGCHDMVIRQTGFDLFYVSDAMKDYTEILSIENAKLKEALSHLLEGISFYLSQPDSGDALDKTMIKAKKLLEQFNNTL